MRTRVHRPRGVADPAKTPAAPQPTRPSLRTGLQDNLGAQRTSLPPFTFATIALHPPRRASIEVESAPVREPPLPLQTRLEVGEADGPLEKEAEHIADRVARMPDAGTMVHVQPAAGHAKVQRACRQCEQDETIRRKADGTSIAAAAAPPIVHDVLRSPGQPLDPGARAFMEPRFGSDFSGVRVHADSQAAASARKVNALAYTVGRDIVFREGAYHPGPPGRRLLAHELTHVVQQRAGPRVVQRDLYTPEQRRSMSEGRTPGTAADLGIATRCDFQPGDIVFRMGQGTLARLIGEPVTHGGIYLGDGLVHDVVGFGNRTVPLVDFYNESADAGVVRIARFTGPLASIIVPRLIRNIRARDFSLPSEPVPWNLFSTADDYRTATCLEYSQAQFLHAIAQLSKELVWSPGILDELQRTYFRAGAASPSPLIHPHTLTLSGPEVAAARRGLMMGADYLAEDVNPRVFQNRWEGQETFSGPMVPGAPFSPILGEERLSTFTYRSFVDATHFFAAVECPSGPGDAVARNRAQVSPISARSTQNMMPGGSPFAFPVTAQTAVVWARHPTGVAYLVVVDTSSIVFGGESIGFRAFVDADLRERALARAALFQPSGVQTIPWNTISRIPAQPAPSTASNGPQRP